MSFSSLQNNYIKVIRLGFAYIFNHMSNKDVIRLYIISFKFSLWYQGTRGDASMVMSISETCGAVVAPEINKTLTCEEKSEFSARNSLLK